MNDDTQDQTEPERFNPVVRSKAFRDILEIAGRVAGFDSSVLLTGETGVGKEVVARYIHGASHRSKNPMLTINCGALSETLLESELFGHKVGSFTGAVRSRVGLFEQAARGTILLDEIGDISLATQVKLLRVLQEREILKIGESIPRKVDTRVIAATNRNLEKAVTEGKFREDLLYRLRVIELRIPPLRDRPEDISSLVDYYVKRLSKRLDLPKLRVEPACLEYFYSYSWPGNVRELRNAVERAAILSDDQVIRAKHLPPQLLHPDIDYWDLRHSTGKTLNDVESEYIKIVLRSTGGNRTRAAKILGISQATLWRKLKNMT